MTGRGLSYHKYLYSQQLVLTGPIPPLASAAVFTATRS